jgi:hypothetical protein
VWQIILLECLSEARLRAVEADENILSATLQTLDRVFFDLEIEANKKPMAAANKKTLYSMEVPCSSKAYLALLDG